MRHFLGILAVFIYFYSDAQSVKSFPENDAEFINTLSTYIGSNNKPETKELGLWIKSNLQNQQDFPKVKDISNLMLKKKILLWPQFYNFFKLVQNSGAATEISPDIITKNYEVLYQLLNANGADANKNFNLYVNYLTKSYQDKSIFSDKIKNWEADGSYKIQIKEGFPVYVFDKLTLKGTTKVDSLTIWETAGEFYPFTSLWKGKKGRVNWHRADYNPNETYVTFSEYEIDLSQSELTTDSSILNFTPYIENSIRGRFNDKLFNTVAASRSYPKFQSYDNWEINISKDIQVTGNVELDGNVIYATNSSRVEPARLKIFDPNIGKVLDSETSRLRIENLKKIESKKAKVYFAYLNDSTPIFHPSCAITYNVETKNLKITRLGTNEAKSPFISPFFKMNLYTDQFDWTIGNTYANMNSTFTNAKLPADFESFNYYKEGVDSKYTQYINVDPIAKIAEFCEDIGFRTISIEEIAGLLQIGSYKSIEGLIYKMMEDGFLNYDSEDGMVYVFDKLMLYAEIRKNPEDTDYDNIKLSSVTQGTVGKLLFDQKKLELLGVEDAPIAPSANIMMALSSDTVYVTENRGIAFKGRLTSGKFNFYSDTITYNYDDNAFNLNKIDSMLIMVPLEQTDSKGNTFYTEINTPIKKISGRIFVSDPSQRNKSVRYTRYPYFVNTDTTVLDFGFTKFGDKYAVESFNFKIYPFTIEKMSTVDTDSIRFKGEFVSDNIFQDMDAELAVNHEDLTLGVNFTTQADGEKLYGGHSVLFGEVSLNKNGLRAKGRIERNNMSFHFDEMTLLPDSAAGDLTKWESVFSDEMVYPELSADSALMSWIPKNDSIYLTLNEDKELKAYQNQFTLKGDFFINGDHLSETGNILIDEDTFQSDKIDLLLHKAIVNNTLVSITKDKNEIFKSGEGTIEINTDSLIAEIKTDTLSEYTDNKIITNYNSFNWDIKNSKISTEATQNDDDKYFEFTENKFAGVRLNAKKSSFDENTKELDLGEITQILVADSKVIPDNAQLKIKDNGMIDILDNAEVVLNTENEYHKLYGATVEITNKNEMKGSGKLDIPVGDELKAIDIESFQTMKNLKDTIIGKKKAVDTLYYVQAKGFIEDAHPLQLSENLLYKGDLLLNSLNRNIELEGFAKPQFNTISDADWFHVSQELDYKNSAFTIDSLKNESGQNIYTGLMLDMYDMRIYPRIMQSKDIPSDRAIYTANGVMKSVPASPIILFGNEEAVDKMSEDKPLLKYNDENGDLEARGEYHLTEDVSPNKIDVYGTSTYIKNSSTPFQIKGSVAFDLYMVDEVNNLLNRFMIDNHVEGKYQKLNGNKELSLTIKRLLGDNAQKDNIARDMVETGVLNLTQDFPYNMVFSDVNLTYDNMEGTFKSVEPVGMMVFAGKPFLQTIKAYIEIGPRKDGDFFHLFLTAANNEWIFIRHYNNELSIISSDANFNNAFESIKPSKKELKSGKEVVYKISSISPTLKDNFLGRMNDFEYQYKKAFGIVDETAPEETIQIPDTEFEIKEQDDNVKDNIENISQPANEALEEKIEEVKDSVKASIPVDIKVHAENDSIQTPEPIEIKNDSIKASIPIDIKVHAENDSIQIPESTEIEINTQIDSVKTKQFIDTEMGKAEDPNKEILDEKMKELINAENSKEEEEKKQLENDTQKDKAKQKNNKRKGKETPDSE